MNQNVVSEISNSLMFRYQIPCSQIKSDDKQAVELPAVNRLPDFSDINGDRSFGQLRGAWSASGIYFWLKVTGKKQSLWCRRTQLLESDGLQIWLDTRDTKNVHRATPSCHWFLLLPEGGGNDQKKPLATMLKINRAKEHSPCINQAPISISSQISKSGYTLSAFIPAVSINGWDVSEHRMIGFNYAIADRELGTQCLGVGMDFPVCEDPSLWSTMKLN